MNEYVMNGFKDRTDYLLHLSREFGVDSGTVFAMASILGPNEDFDGLVSELEDMAEEG